MISAYIPCFNNVATIRAAAESLLNQTTRPAEVLVVDDGSTDGLRDALAGLPVRIIRHDRNLGRGAARARAMLEAKHDFVVCCDATNVMAPDFVAQGITWFVEPNTAAVFGRIDQHGGGDVVQRWRGRHLFKVATQREATPGAVAGARFATWGAMVRKSALLHVGNYQADLRHAEDADIGGRLDAAGWRVVYDARLAVFSIAENSLGQVLERYWRWTVGQKTRATWNEYGKNIRYSIGMAGGDFFCGMPGVAVISLLCPHYCFWRSRRLMKRHVAGGV